MSSSKEKKPLVTDPKEPLLIIALYQAVKEVVEYAGYSPKVSRVIDRYEKEYGKNST